WLWVQDRGKVVTRTADGNPLRAVGTYQDITELKRVETSFRQAQGEAEQANQAKSRFLATMSHEIRTPLNTILGIGEILQVSESLTSRERNLVDVANNAGNMLLALINNILDLSKIEANEVRLEEIAFNPGLEAQQATSMIAVAAARKGIDLSCLLAPDLPAQVCGDVYRLRQVLLNLLNNALKFTATGSITMQVATSADQMLVFSISDSGIGIAEEMRDVIFQPFSQAEESTTRHFGGTGLGLSICQKLVTKMGGSLWFESQIDRGSVFHFTVNMPWGSSNFHTELVSPFTGASSLLSSHPAAAEQGLRILLVDDLDDNRLVVKAFLEGTDCQLVEADSGEDALYKLLSGPFDLILMDIMMPGMNGLETTRKIRVIEAANGSWRTPIVALSANSMKDDMEKSYAAGCDFYLIKPLRRAVLLDLLSHFATRTASAGQRRLAGTDDVCIDNELKAVVCSTSDAINTDVLTALREETGSEFEPILKLFLRRFPERMESLTAAWKKEDLNEIRRISHGLCGASATFGAQTLASLCTELGDSVYQSIKTVTSSVIIQKIVAESDRVQQELRSFLSQQPVQ
ncbi:MAG: response regulator, partial [Magnetococcales bacterium]|nr:response regulator [Magnetococcales bacterium]